MSSQSKTSSAGHAASGGSAGLYRVAIVGAATLKGKELAEALNERNFPAVDIKLLDDDESIGQLETVRDEVSFIQRLRTEEFEHVDFSFLASDQDCARATWKTARQAGSAIVDLSYALEDEPGATVRSPWLERQLGRSLALDLQPGPAVIAHPAAVVLGMILLRAQNVGRLKRVAATVFEPASEHGQKGMDELHEQTVSLLSFQQMPKSVFDTQVAFNMVSRYGAQSALPLSTVEDRILKHYKRVVGDAAPVPSLLLAQAPIFHGYAFAVHLEMDVPADIDVLSKCMAGDHVTIAQGTDEAPSNVSVAGQGDVLLSIVPDANLPNAVWLWAAADNLRIAALTAVECAESMAATRPRGTVQ